MPNDRLFTVCHSRNLSALSTGSKSHLAYQKSNGVVQSLKRYDCSIPRFVEKVEQTKKPLTNFWQSLATF
ncbi:hypothetical protein HMPREF3209_02292 [Lactobacillus crispatus]|nr:hypothetical protein HMPREF3209_02292 [Lactobacillus crispatus]